MEQLRASLDQRLAELAALRPDLDRALTLQRTLLGRQIDMLDLFRQGGVPGVSLPPRYLAVKLGRGVPALHGEPIPLPSKVLELSAREYATHLAAGGAGDAAASVAQAMESGALDGTALISACFGRDQRRVRFMAAQAHVSPDLAWLVAELALAPFAYLLQCRAVAQGLSPVAQGLSPADSSSVAQGSTPATSGSVAQGFSPADSGSVAQGFSPAARWNRGFCPVCGSWPAFAEVVAGRHTLRCSFCAAAWALDSYRCLYCANDGDTFVTAAPNPEQAGRRLQLCGQCGGYMKVLDVTTATEFPQIAVEDLASMDLDMIAIERKYMRPALPEIKRG